MILAGGAGTRLEPLTRDRAKPAVPFGGRYRIIDFCLSNFVHSSIFKLKVLTQYKSDSLNNHISRAWRMSAFLGQYCESVPAQMRTGSDWYRGSADAIWQNLNLITDESPDLVYVFGADHVYQMDARQMEAYHVAKRADCTVAAIPVPIEEAHDFGAPLGLPDPRVRDLRAVQARQRIGQREVADLALVVVRGVGPLGEGAEARGEEQTGGK